MATWQNSFQSEAKSHLAARDLATSRLDLFDLRDFRTLSTFVIRVIREAGQPSSLNRFSLFQREGDRLQVINQNKQ